MSTIATTATHPPALGDPRQMRRVLFSSFLGSAVEFYDFLLYGTAAALESPTTRMTSEMSTHD